MGILECGGPGHVRRTCPRRFAACLMAMRAAARRSPAPRLQPWRKRSCGQSGSFQNLILKGHAFGIVFLKPFFRGVRGGEDLDVLGVANLLAGYSRRQTLSLVSLQLSFAPMVPLSVNSRGLLAFNARSIPTPRAQAGPGAGGRRAGLRGSLRGEEDEEIRERCEEGRQEGRQQPQACRASARTLSDGRRRTSPWAHWADVCGFANALAAKLLSNA
jgi:hypothetical protein